ncbi:hypothetical protein J5N97_014799 [Dioscorea zingiberensis]|uniref:Uncharacterized protein n=1 Tax=Dioscorea zingiberensis TaxID=325984 RepID=A0A9D5CT06_9LILI|nr:hypothetical protein J5N97_014799 [Dioscorea zingiberensis]
MGSRARLSSQVSPQLCPVVLRRELGLSNTRAFALRVSSSESLIKRVDHYKNLVGHRGIIHTVRFNDSGQFIISAADDKNVIIWDWAEGTQKFVYPTGHEEKVLDAQILPFTGDCSIITSSVDGQVRLAEVTDDGLVTITVLGTHYGRVPQLAIEPGSPRIFYSCGEDGIVQRFDLRSPTPTRLFSCISFSGTGLPVQLRCINMDPRNSNYFAIGGFEQFVRLYDIRNYRWDASTCCDLPVTTYCPHHLMDSLDNRITGLAYSNKSELLASYDDEQVYLFERNMGIGPIPTSVSEEHLQSLPQPQAYFGRSNVLAFKSVAFFGRSEDYVVTGSDCSNIFIWRKKGGKLLRKMVGDARNVHCVSTHPDALFLGSGGNDGIVKVWAPVGETPVEEEPELGFIGREAKLVGEDEEEAGEDSNTTFKEEFSSGFKFKDFIEMQTSKTRTGSSDGPQRLSPKSTRANKTSGSESDSNTTNTSKRASIEKSPKVVARRSPRSPVTEKKHVSRLSELELQLAQLQEELKKTKDQLNSSEAWKRKAQQEAEEAKMQLMAMKVKLEDSEHQFVEFSAAEEERIQELRKISQDRDREWQSELEAMQKQHSMDSTALSSAMNEMQRLKVQLDIVIKSEAAYAKQYELAHTELQTMKQDIALEAAEIKHQEQQIQNTLHLHSVHELMEQMKIVTESELKNANAEISELKKANMELEVSELKAKLMDKETELQSIAEENKEQELAIRNKGQQLDIAQTLNAEMEAELGRLRVQADQWRKAAEAAAAVLTTGNFLERTQSMDTDYGKLTSSPPFSDDLSDDSPKKKKNNNMLKKIGGLWKKGRGTNN